MYPLKARLREWSEANNSTMGTDAIDRIEELEYELEVARREERERCAKVADELSATSEERIGEVIRYHDFGDILRALGDEK